jgi:hypothetical protein
MLNYSELTVIKNSDGMATALGYPINSILLQNNKPLFVGGGGKKKVKKHGVSNEESEYENNFEELAVPAGLVCMTQTICRNANAMESEVSYQNEMEPETIPEGLYEQLLSLAESKPAKKLSRRKQVVHKKGKNKTHKHK